MNRHRALDRLGLVALMVVALFLVLGLSAGTTSAALDACRDDPILVLSNGKVLSVGVDIDAAAANVQNVDYTIRLPAGVTVESVLHTGEGLPETLTVTSDAATPIYSSQVQVTLYSGTANVTATLTVDENAKSGWGLSGKTLMVLLALPH